MGSDGFTPSRGASYQYFIEYGLYKCCEDEFNYLRAITTRGGRIISLIKRVFVGSRNFSKIIYTAEKVL
jgi:hypothetical protein